MSINSFIRRQFANAVSVAAQLGAGGLSNSATTFSVGTGQGSTFPTGGTGPFTVTVDQGTASEERIQCSSRSGDTFTVNTNGRGYNGYSAVAHNPGASVLHTMDQQDLDEANQVVVATLGAVTASGDLLVGSGTNALTKLARGTQNQFLQAGASQLQWTSFGSSRSQSIGSANSDGSDTTPARSDHVHKLGSTDTTTSTFSNKRITPRVVSQASTATPTINTDNTDVAEITSLATNITSMSTNLSGTPNDGETLRVIIIDNGTTRTITWGAKFASGSTAQLPTFTNPSQALIVDFAWNATLSGWICSGNSQLSNVSASLSSNYTLTTSFATALTTPTLSEGVWLVTMTALVFEGSGAGGADIEIQAALGTATATFSGPTAVEIANVTIAAALVSMSTTFVATVTAAGTLLMQAKAASITGGPVLEFQTNQGSSRATGFTAVKIG